MKVKYIFIGLILVIIVFIVNSYRSKANVYITYDLEKIQLEMQFNKEFKLSYPRKIVKKKKGERYYGLSINSSESVFFKPLKRTKIEEKEIDNLNVISIDSIIKLLPFLGYSNSKSKNIEFNVIEISKDGIVNIKVEPTLITYD